MEEKKPKAGSNEITFRKSVGSSVKLEGKVTFNSGNSGVSISVDQSFSLDGKKYLVEVDSANMAKLLVGQYTLICALTPYPLEDFVFLVVHYFKDYNPKRTMKNLHEINELVFAGHGMKFLAIHADQFEDSGSKFLDLIKQI